MLSAYLKEHGGVQHGSYELVDRWLGDKAGYLWLDLSGEIGEPEQEILSALGIHSLVITDLQQRRHPPKVEELDGYTFILFRGFATMSEDLPVASQQLGFIVTDRLMITVHYEMSISVTAFWNRDDLETLIQHPRMLATKIIDFATKRYLAVVLNFEEHLTGLEDRLPSIQSDSVMAELVAYRARLLRLRRVFDYHLKLAENLVESHWGGIAGEEDLALKIRDLFDHCERLHSLTAMYYEICGDLVESHISLSSHQLNQTMQILTVITAIFVPMSFLAGVYGMNFVNMPELTWHNGYFILLGVMGFIGIGLLYMFRRRRWI